MIAFLEQIAASISIDDLPALYKHCYIFPTKRAAHQFSRFLRNQFSQENFVLPETLTIEEFLTSYSSYVIKEDWYILLELYSIQFELTQSHQTLDKFLPWGKLILKDFDECDKYLVDAQQLFSALKAHKALDEQFVISDELRNCIEKFILTNSSDKENIYKEAFIKTWEMLGEMYKRLQERLGHKGFAYAGMAYKEVLQKLTDNSLKLPYQSISFCGFNALSVCEEKIFKVIEQQYPTTFWWDADDLFLQNTFHEAGNFLRRYRQIFSGKNNYWISSDALRQNKNIQIIGVSSEVGQAQYVAQQLSKNTDKNTAVVLCNEQLLSPLLYALNDGLNVNVTMGYNLAQSELYLFVHALLSLWCNARITEKQIDFYHKDIQVISEHPFLQHQIKDKRKLEEILPIFVPYMQQDVLASFFTPSIVQTAENPLEILTNTLTVVSTLQQEDNYFIATKDAMLNALKELAKLIADLQTSFAESDVIINRNALPFIVKQFIGGIKIPFKDIQDTQNDTVNTTQIMGFLETRIMDFEHLYILSLNDDKLPGTNKINSFIPYSLRKFFGLPTFEQFDGINAYHFYRLLKRASNIHLLYNNQSDDNAGEKSRFIRQIQHDLATDTNTITALIATYSFKEKTAITEATIEANVLKVEKTPEMINTLRGREFSSTALNLYIKCPLLFYLEYIENIKEPEDLSEEIDAAIFGRILHKILEYVYAPHIGKVVSAEIIRPMSDATFLRNQIKIACEELKLPKEITQGSNRLSLRIIERIAQKILENDIKETPFTVLGTEKKFVWDKLPLADQTFATICGAIDRVDAVRKNAVRIVDYKTGKIELLKFPDINDNADVDKFLEILFSFEKKNYSATFQGFLYALMYYKLHGCTEIYIAYHQAKNMKNGLVYLNEQQPIPIELLLKFEQRLTELVSDIIYRVPYFEQSGNENAYAYSSFAEMFEI